jgi:hypothetical protein
MQTMLPPKYALVKSLFILTNRETLPVWLYHRFLIFQDLYVNKIIS